jgi:hypothetical protein
MYYPGEIVRLHGEVIHVNYDEGEEETTSIRLIRVEREGCATRPWGIRLETISRLGGRRA